MRHPLREGAILLAAAVLAGCASNVAFVYTPNAPVAGAPKIAAGVAVVAFTDGTEDFEKRGPDAVRVVAQYNHAKTGSHTVSALPPELWAKFFADDLAASGSFGSARFVYSASELAREEYVVEGVVTKAYRAVSSRGVSEFAVALTARRTADNSVVWTKEVGRTWTGREMGAAKKTARPANRYGDQVNKALQGMFAEARAGFLAAIGRSAAGRAGGDVLPGVPPANGDGAGPGPPGAQASESPEQTIERILGEK